MIKSINDISCSFLQELDLLCFSHLRWGFVFQRPNHLLTRFSKHQRVFFFEEPIFSSNDEKLHIENYNQNLYVVTPHLQEGLTEGEVITKQQQMVSQLMMKMNIDRHISWYYTPMALPFTN